MKTKHFFVIFVAILLVVMGCSDSKTTEPPPPQTALVNIGLSTNDGGSVVGAIVRLENHDGNPSHIYERIATSQTVNFSEVVFGSYALRITHIGYFTNVSNIFAVQTETVDRAAALVAEIEYNVGDVGPAGGIIFHDKGFVSDEWRYLEAAPVDFEFSAQWGASDQNIAGTQITVGAGRRNTELIVERLNQLGETGRAAQICHVMTINGFQDWFLPSRNELNLMYRNLRVQGLGAFLTTYYWSSSQVSADGTWSQGFSDGIQYYDYKGNTNRVRAVRAF